MVVSKNSFLVGLLVFLCLSLSFAHRVLKDNDGENELTSDIIPSEQPHDFNHAELKGGIPKFSTVGSTNGDCCNYGSNCGGHTCPPNYGCGGNSGCESCGGNSGCQSCYSCSPCQWQGCQGCQGSPPPCGCLVRIDNNSKVQQESTQMAEPEPPTYGVVPSAQPANHNIKSSGGANQDVESNGGLV